MGMSEELGELAHALLKRAQKIRGTHAAHTSAAQDAIGDILVYILAMCEFQGWDASAILSETWSRVARRDWKRFPVDGVAR